MDFVNYPLNDRWWLEDQFDRIDSMTIRRPSSSRSTSFAIGRTREGRLLRRARGRRPVAAHAEDSQRRRRDAGYHEFPMPTQRWMAAQSGSALRFAWHKYLNRIPTGLTYTALDPQATYTVKLFSQRPTSLLIDGKPAPLIRTGPTYDQVTEQEFPVPHETIQDGRIVVNWVNSERAGHELAKAALRDRYLGHPPLAPRWNRSRLPLTDRHRFVSSRASLVQFDCVCYHLHGAEFARCPHFRKTKPPKSSPR